MSAVTIKADGLVLSIYVFSFLSEQFNIWKTLYTIKLT